MTAAPESFTDRLRRVGLISGPAPVPFAAAPTTSAPAGDPRARRYAEAALRGEIEAVANSIEGTRNHTLNKAAWKLGTLVEAGHLTGDEVVQALTIAAGQVGLSVSEIARTVPRSIRDARSKAGPRIVPEQESVEAAYVLDPAMPSQVAERFPRIDWQALWADETEEDWICEPLLAVGRAIVLYSPPKVGKSLLTLEIAAGIATGGTVLGEKVQRRRVLYVDFENDPRGDIRTRLQAMGYDWNQLDDLVVLSYPTMAALDSPQGGDELLAAAAHYDAQVIIIDTLSRAVAGEENSNDTYLAFYRHTVLRCKQAGIAMMRLDHSGKDESKGMRGASAKESDVDAVWRLSRLDDAQLTLECTHHRMQIADTDLLLIRKDLPHLHHSLDTSGRKAAFDAKVVAIVAVLDGAKVPADAGERPCRDALKRTGVSAGAAALREAVKRRRATISIWDEAAK